jgi:hypothetical protein
MSRSESEPPKEHLYGAQEAAQYLGIHRSTLHLACQRGLVTPDQTTPGGHLRFRRETLDHFRAQLTYLPATSELAALAPLTALATITSGISARLSAEEICQAAVESIQRAQPGIDGVAVALVDMEAAPPRTPQLIAHTGLPEAFVAEYQRLCDQHIEVAGTYVMKTRQPEYIEDTEVEPLRLGSARLARLAAYRSYAVVPLLQGEQGLGALILASSTPHRFTPSDRLFLDATAAELALAVRIDLYLALTSDLILCALGRPVEPEPTAGKATARLAQLRELLLNRTDAVDVCALGFDDGGSLGAHHPELRALAERAMESEALARGEWFQDDVPYTGLAASIRLYDEQVASVAAAWPGHRPKSQVDRSLLLVFAGACALASGRVKLDAFRAGQTPPEPEDEDNAP